MAPDDGGVVGRGSDSVSRAGRRAREALQDLFDSFAELHLEISEIRDLGDRVLANGWMRARGTESGVEIESPWAYLLEFKNGKATWVRAFLDPQAAPRSCRATGVDPSRPQRLPASNPMQSSSEPNRFPTVRPRTTVGLGGLLPLAQLLRLARLGSSRLPWCVYGRLAAERDPLLGIVLSFRRQRSNAHHSPKPRRRTARPATTARITSLVCVFATSTSRFGPRTVTVSVLVSPSE